MVFLLLLASFVVLLSPPPFECLPFSLVLLFPCFSLNWWRKLSLHAANPAVFAALLLGGGLQLKSDGDCFSPSDLEVPKGHGGSRNLHEALGSPCLEPSKNGSDNLASFSPHVPRF